MGVIPAFGFGMALRPGFGPGQRGNVSVAKRLTVAGTGPQMSIQQGHSTRTASFCYEMSDVLIALGPVVGSGLRFLFTRTFLQSGQYADNGNDINIEGAGIVVGSTFNGTSWSGGTFYPITFAGSSSVTLTAGTPEVLSDLNIPGYTPTPNDVIRLLTVNNVAAGGYNLGMRWSLKPSLGEGNRNASTTQIARLTPTGINGAIGYGNFSGGAFSACAVFTDAPEGTRAVLLTGDSRTYGANSLQEFASSRGVLGYVQQAMDDLATGRLPVWDISCTGASFSSYINASVGANKWLAAVIANVFGGKAPFDRVIATLGTNDFAGGAPLAQMQSRSASHVSQIKAIDPAYITKVWLDTVGPTTSAPGAGTGFAISEAEQTTWVRADQGPDPSNRSIWNAYVRAGSASAQGYTGFFDTAVVNEGTAPAKIKPTGFNTTLVTAITAASTKVVTLAGDPGVGNQLVFEPQDATNYDNHTSNYTVLSVTGSTGNYTVTLRNNVAKAHAAGSVVYTIPSSDNLHYSSKRQIDQRNVLIAVKSSLGLSA